MVHFTPVDPCFPDSLSSRLPSPLLLCLLLADILGIDDVRWNAIFEVLVVQFLLEL